MFGLTKQNEEQQEVTVEQKLRSMSSDQLEELAPQWKAIWQNDKSPDNTHNWILLKRECARRGIKT